MNLKWPLASVIFSVSHTGRLLGAIRLFPLLHWFCLYVRDVVWFTPWKPLTRLFSQVAHRLSRSTLNHLEHIHIYKLLHSGESWIFVATEHFHKTHISDPREKWRAIKVKQVGEATARLQGQRLRTDWIKRELLLPKTLLSFCRGHCNLLCFTCSGFRWWSRRCTDNLVAHGRLNASWSSIFRKSLIQHVAFALFKFDQCCHSLD